MLILKKGEVSLVPAQTIKTHGDLKYNSIHSEPRHYMDLSGQLYGRAALSQAKSPGTHQAKGSNEHA
jgi:hypothetical protein